MATLTFHPAVLTAALHAGSAAARLATTTTDPDGGGDGSWYGTLQPGYGNYVVLATKLPA